MNILVTGANGQLGNELRLLSQSSAHNYYFTDIQGEDIKYLDITDLEAVRAFVRGHEITCIINCAAYTNVEAAENNFALAEKLNAQAALKLALVMKECDGLLVHISTDYVFGKEIYNKPCTEEQEGTPTGVYGLTKLHGEQNIIGSGCKFLIFRTSWLYSEFGKNFCKTMLELTSSRHIVKVVFDQVGTPTYAWDLAKAIIYIIDNKLFEEKYGIYNYSNEGLCSWYDFAKAIALYSGHNDCNILPCHSNEFPSAVVRPAYSVLDKTKFKSTFGVEIPYWTDSLQKCINNLK